MACSNEIQCRVLVVDFNSSQTFNMFQSRGYLATHCQVAQHVVVYLQRQQFDIVVIVGLLNSIFDKFDILNDVTSNTKRPVIIMISDDYSQRSVIEARRRGCSFYHYFPIRVETVNEMWQHMFLNRFAREETVSNGNNNGTIINPNNIKDNEEFGDQADQGGEKKPRVVWSDDLHKPFVSAVQRLGGCKKAVPLKILRVMNALGINGLSREKIASHLQKYRGMINKQASTSSKTSSHPKYSHLTKLSINNNGVQNMIQHQNPGYVHRTNSLPDISSSNHFQLLARTNMKSNFNFEAHHQNPNTNNFHVPVLQQQAYNNNSQAVVINDQIHGFNNYQSSVPVPVPANRDDLFFLGDSFANDEADPQNSDRPRQN